MKTKPKQSGVTLMEMTVVVAAIALLTVFALPAVKTLFDSLASTGGTKAMISATLSSARALAAREQRYVGIRFQNAYSSGDLLDASQYMVFVVHDPNISAYGFRVVENLEPIKLPDSVGVMDLRVAVSPIDLDSEINDESELRDTTAFSIIFSPTGRLAIHDVRVRNKDGAPKWPSTSDDSKDDIFNAQTNVENGIAMFYQDDAVSGLAQEASRNSFIIYDTLKLKQVDSGNRYTDYLQHLESSKIYINSYTGTIINN